jgi:hypothetical protein
VTVYWLWRRDTSVKSVALVGKRNGPCFYQGSRDSSVIIVTRLRAGRSVVRVPAEEGHLSFLDIVWTVSGAHRAPCSMDSVVLSREQSGQGVMLTTHLHAAPRFGMSGDKRLFPYTPPWRGQGQLFPILYTPLTTTTPLSFHLLAYFGEAAQPCVFSPRSGGLLRSNQQLQQRWSHGRCAETNVMRSNEEELKDTAGAFI